MTDEAIQWLRQVRMEFDYDGPGLGAECLPALAREFGAKKPQRNSRAAGVLV